MGHLAAWMAARCRCSDAGVDRSSGASVVEQLKSEVLACAYCCALAQFVSPGMPESQCHAHNVRPRHKGLILIVIAKGSQRGRAPQGLRVQRSASVSPAALPRLRFASRGLAVEFCQLRLEWCESYVSHATCQ